MKKPKQYLTFEYVADSTGKKKTKRVRISSTLHPGCLGVIQWYPQWRKYTFQPWPETVWDILCLKEVSDEIRRLELIRLGNKRG